MSRFENTARALQPEPQEEDVMELRPEEIEVVSDSHRKESAERIISKKPESEKRIKPPIRAEVMQRRAEKEARIAEEDARINENVERIRKTLGPTRDRLMFKSGHARDTARLLIQEFKSALESKKMTDEDMDEWGERLADKRDDLEDLNREMRLVPTDTFRTSDLMNENFKAIEEVQDAVRASQMEAPRALAELKFGTGVHAVEKILIAPGELATDTTKQLEHEIQAKYGMHPEELMGGGGWKGLKFRLMNSLSHLTGQDSLYTRWRDAKATKDRSEWTADTKRAHEAHIRETPEIRAERQEVAAEDEAMRMKALEGKTQKNRDFAMEALTQKRASEIWETVNDQMKLMQSENPDGYSFTAEEYVITAARYADAMGNNLKGGIKEYGTMLKKMNKELDFPEGIDPLLGDSKSRLTRTRSLGGPSRAREELAQVVSGVTGLPVRPVGRSRTKGTLHERPAMEQAAPLEITEEMDMRARVNRALKGNAEAVRVMAAESKSIKPGSLDDVYIDAVARLNEALRGTDTKLIAKEQKHVDHLNEVLFKIKPLKPIADRFVPGKKKKQRKPVAERFLPKRPKPPIQEAA
ncbi:hypothetical protein KJ781_01995 [Patescibacteria group bacterium]|nr:hypothetical protein [Patescibacteria group bacterium]MBU1448247.1 hypothetical protein [Patescibacteria group bacterium]MBU2613687.1 hypothetical protein [Patescibacteria group bacterium]